MVVASSSSVTIVAFATIGAVAGLHWQSRVRSTTLTAVVAWTSISLASIAAVELLGLCFKQTFASPLESLRFVAATSVFCPLVARLGAKRPQHKAWQFVVATLWLVLASPAIERFVLQPDQPMEVVGARSWFLVVLVAVGFFDRILTRFAIVAFLAAIGQLFLLGSYLPLPSNLFEFDDGYGVGVALISVSVLLEVFDLPRRHAPADDLDKLWLDFRDGFGTLWALRILQRFNDTATRHEWNVRLTWMGFHWSSADKDGTTAPFRTTFDNLLRRFVSPDWIARRQLEDVHWRRDK